MELVRWNPVRDMFSLRNRMNRMHHMLDESFYPASTNDEERSVWSWKPVVDIVDDDSNYVIKAELPGIDKKDITIDVKDRVLTLKGERSSKNEVKEDKYFRRERTYGKFERIFTLPADVDSESIKADYKDGVLAIDIPKPVEKKPKKITIH